MAYIDQFPNQCGMSIIHALSGLDNLEEQIETIEQGFEDACILFISDVVDSAPWSETKAVADRGPIRVNPNSGNRITYWTILPKHLKQLKIKLAALKKKKGLVPKKIKMKNAAYKF